MRDAVSSQPDLSKLPFRDQLASLTKAVAAEFGRTPEEVDEVLRKVGLADARPEPPRPATITVRLRVSFDAQFEVTPQTVQQTVLRPEQVAANRAGLAVALALPDLLTERDLNEEVRLLRVSAVSTNIVPEQSYSP